MSEPYAAAPRPGDAEGSQYLAGVGAGPSSSGSPTTYAPVDPNATPGVGRRYAEALTHAALSEGTRGTGGAAATRGQRQTRAGFQFPGTETLDPGEVFRGPGYQAPRPPKSGTATAALTLALLGFIPLLSPIALLLGYVALGDTAEGLKSGRGKAEAAVSLGVMGTILWGLMLLAYLVNQ